MLRNWRRDFFDTQKDLMNNLLGSITALGLYGAARLPANLGGWFWARDPLRETASA